jgi:hypothetical protein
LQRPAEGFLVQTGRQYHDALCRLGARLKLLALEKPEALRQFMGRRP